MCSELECGVCYQTYNAGRRCPRELRCKHSFCESCLRALARPLEEDEPRLGVDRSSIMCPLCRYTTSISAEDKLRAELPVDECVLEQLLAAGVLEQVEEEEDEEEAAEGSPVVDGCVDHSEEATLPETSADESDAVAVSRGGRLRRSCRKVWQKISGKNSQQRSRENCMTSADLRNLALMSCYMF
ncbi:uncharacterized protein V6R79_014150 [Siganus canaliculatus]